MIITEFRKGTGHVPASRPWDGTGQGHFFRGTRGTRDAKYKKGQGHKGRGTQNAKRERDTRDEGHILWGHGDVSRPSVSLTSTELF